jgi:hypothetical protein
MFGLPNPYLIGGVALVIAGLAGWGIWQTHELGVAREHQQLAEEKLATAKQDAARWEAASDVRDVAILNLKASLDEQSAAVMASRAKEAELRKNLDSARQQNDRLQAEANALSVELDAEAAKAPGDVRELGPIVLRRAGELFK